jgi:beta-1,2-mannobiose phosphorylase / 1,2-beta-oligomannan phosphorylase
MINVVKHGILLNKTALGFENEGVLNPAAIREGNKVHLFYRAVSKGNYSSIGYCRLDGPLTVEERSDVPLIYAGTDSESHGVEDARIVKIDDLYYLTYTAYDGQNARGALATSTDLQHFEKYGVITPQLPYAEFNRLATSRDPLNEKYARFNGYDHSAGNTTSNAIVWDKNVVFFPRRIGGKLHFLHRIRPDIQWAAVQDLSELTNDYWTNYLLHFQDNIALVPKHKHEVSYIGSGCPPIETAAGWLLIYHGVHDTPAGYVYTACAALLDLDNPKQEIARLPYPLFAPKYDWELNGEVNNVCFPTGAVVFDDRLYLYYGAADERIACASVLLSDLLTALLANTKHASPTTIHE